MPPRSIHAVANLLVIGVTKRDLFRLAGTPPDDLVRAVQDSARAVDRETLTAGFTAASTQGRGRTGSSWFEEGGRGGGPGVLQRCKEGVVPRDGAGRVKSRAAGRGVSDRLAAPESARALESGR